MDAITPMGLSQGQAHLFAAAPAMYEELHQNLIVLTAQYEAAEKAGASQELLDILQGRVRGTVTALRAANPDAFNTTGQASEPEGEVSHD